ncbi:MAG: hypothetical protein VYA55_06810 [Pseudomonadota bacterium]|nr:hypothetical protein [Pseudomonadota bacterium]
MNRSLALGLTLIGALSSADAVLAAQETAQAADLDSVKVELEEARAAVEEARQIAEQIVLEAQQHANQIRQSSVVNDQAGDLSPVEIQRGQVAVEVSAATVEEIAVAIMPSDWRVLVDVKNKDVLQKRFQYVTTKSRDQALRDLLAPIGLKHQYFFDLKDASGAKTPLLVISQR